MFFIYQLISRSSFSGKTISYSVYNSNPQGRRTSERFIKPAIPTPSLGLNTSAPNIMSHHGILGSSHIAGHASSSTNSTIGSNPNSLNSSLSSASNTPLPHANSNISFSGHSSSFTQPASPMDTSVCKD